MAELPDVPSLRVLEPPSGGLEKLRDRLETRTRSPWLFAIPALVVAILVSMLVLSGVTRTASRVASRPPTAIRDRSVGDAFYWVASTPGAPRPTRSAVISIDDAPSVQAYTMP
jgi:hypothetical protein